jgi:hypothetical protein
LYLQWEEWEIVVYGSEFGFEVGRSMSVVTEGFDEEFVVECVEGDELIEEIEGFCGVGYTGSGGTFIHHAFKTVLGFVYEEGIEGSIIIGIEFEFYERGNGFVNGHAEFGTICATGEKDVKHFVSEDVEVIPICSGAFRRGIELEYVVKVFDIEFNVVVLVDLGSDVGREFFDGVSGFVIKDVVGFLGSITEENS